MKMKHPKAHHLENTGDKTEKFSNGMNVVFIAFGEALGWIKNLFEKYDLMDVHCAGAQRSHPQFGDEDDNPYGYGP